MRLLLFIILISICSKLFAQTGNDSIARIQYIKDVVASINTKELTAITIDDVDKIIGHGADGGAVLRGYYDNGKLVKIYFSIGLSYGMINDEYFISNDSLLFMYETEKDYPINNDTLDYRTTEPVMEVRYYFFPNGKCTPIVSGKPRTRPMSDVLDVGMLKIEYKNYVDLLRTTYKKP